MTPPPLTVLAVVGSLNRASTTRVAIKSIAERLEAAGVRVDLLDLLRNPWPCSARTLRTRMKLGGILAHQRQADLAGGEPRFLARLRP